jgi:hypothetical protein
MFCSFRTALLSLFIILTCALAASADAENGFKSFAIGIDTGYTLIAAFNGGYGLGVETEYAFVGNMSVFADFGYENEYLWTTNSQFFYGYGGLRYYLTFDALAGPWVGLSAGYNSITVPVDSGFYQNIIFPIEAGYKFILDNVTGFYLEPKGSFVVIPYINYNVGLAASWALFIGVDAGFSF